MNGKGSIVLESEDEVPNHVVGEQTLTISDTERVSRSGESMKGAQLTERQRTVLEAIRRAVRETGLPPTRTELAKALNFEHASAVKGHLEALAKKGWVTLLPSVERGILLAREGMPILDSEHLPAVAAGTPNVIEECRDLPRLHTLDSVLDQFEARPDYLVRVEGDSLDRAGFATGDIVAVRRQPEAQDGDIVLARLGQEVTLKRYERTGPHTIELQPVSSNPDHESIEIGPTTDDAEIVGIVVGAIVGTRRGAE